MRYNARRQRLGRAAHPDESGNAIRDLFTNKSVAKLTALGKKYVADANDRMASLIQEKDVDTEVRNGTVYLSRKSLGLPMSPRRGDFGGSPWISNRDAIRDGHIAIGEPRTGTLRSLHESGVAWLARQSLKKWSLR